MRKDRAYGSLLFIIYGNMALYGFIQTMRGVIYPIIKSHYGVSYSEQGLLVFLIQAVMVFSCVVSGIFLSRAGFRKTIFLGFGVAALGMIFFRFAGAYWTAAGFILLIQLGLGFFEIGINGIGARTFTKNSALMMNLLHFFYGVGATFGPWFGGFAANNPALGWRNIYLVSLIPAGVMLALTAFLLPAGAGKSSEKAAVDSAGDSGGTSPEKKYSLRWAVSNRLVWRVAVCLGLVGVVEYGATNWSGLYLLDVFGEDPKTTGAAFVSVYFLLFTVSRLVSGFVTEKIGYLRSVFFGVAAAVIILVTGFALGRGGIWLLPVSGLFLGVAFPTILAMTIGFFGKGAQSAVSVIIVISFSLNGVIQFLIGLINRFIGEAWGYRSGVLFGIVLLVLLTRLRRGKEQGTVSN